MRLTGLEVSAIKERVRSFDPQAKVFLFGSLVDDSKKGGDIDLFILSERIKRHEIRLIRINLYDKIGEQKIDIVATPKILKTFHHIAISTGVEL